MVEHCVTYPLKLELCIEDILSNCNILIDEKYDLTKLKFFNLDATSLLLFQKYLLCENKKISDMQELVIALRIFWTSDIIERHIMERFKTILLQDNAYRILLDKIYWSCQPTDVNEISGYESEFHYLLKNNLVKYNTNGKIISCHSIYQLCYRKHFLPEIQNLNYKAGSPEDLRVKFLISSDIQTLTDCTKQVGELFESKSYFKLNYILKDVFNSETHIVLKNILSTYEYYQLYYIYAYAAHQSGETDECENRFKEIQEETSIEYNAKLLQLSLKCLWELGVIAYENMQYKDVIIKKDKAIKIIEKINCVSQVKYKLQQNINYHDFLVLDALIQKECDPSKDNELYNNYLADMKTSGFYYRALSFSARYALTLCCTNIQLCIEMLYTTGKTILKEYGEEDKHYLWCMFYYYFYMMISENNHTLFEKVTYFHEKMRINQYGNYRKKLYAMAAYLYNIGDISGGNQYLFQDSIFPYETRKRYKAFYYETLALNEALKGNLTVAIKYLDDAIGYLGSIESYLFIPKHNKKVLADKKFSASKISFYINRKVDLSTYYIDPRSAW